jgi:hypothetical protein
LDRRSGPLNETEPTPHTGARAAIEPKQLIFVGGLHRSGTSLLADLLGAHPAISGLTGTGAWHDEGQFLQDVYPTAHDCGGPGQFAFGAGAHLTETDVDDPAAARRRLLASWSPYWNIERQYFVEKSPPNLLRFRYLQAVFPEATFVAIVRHPVAVAYATQGWARISLTKLIEHWLHAHETFERDRRYITRLALVRYEDLVADVPATLASIEDLIGVEHEEPVIDVKRDTNARYLRRWRHSRLLPRHPRVVLGARRFDRRIAALGYGYSLHDRPGTELT